MLAGRGVCFMSVELRDVYLFLSVCVYPDVMFYDGEGGAEDLVVSFEALLSEAWKEELKDITARVSMSTQAKKDRREVAGERHVRV